VLDPIHLLTMNRNLSQGLSEVVSIGIDNDPPKVLSFHNPSENDVAENDDDSSNFDETESINNRRCFVDSNDGLTSDDVLYRIESVVNHILVALDRKEIPIIEPFQQNNRIAIDTEDGNSVGIINRKKKYIATKRFTVNQCRSFTGVVLVASFCQSLILQKKTTTSREVYYYYVTHFKNQRECDNAIWDLCCLLNLPRHLLNIIASPKGWFCGDIQLYSKTLSTSCSHHVGNTKSNKRRFNDGYEQEIFVEFEEKILLDGRSIPSVHGAPISSEWLLPFQQRNFGVQTVAATCILVVEKEGVYNRLSEDQFYKKYPCIIITGKGFPDFATRAMVATLHNELNLPVRGLADCNPFGVLILNTYQHSNRSIGSHQQNLVVDRRKKDQDNHSEMIFNEVDIDPWGVPVDWIGLRPSQISHIMNKHSAKKVATSNYVTNGTVLPPEVFQQLTTIDKQRLFGTLLKEGDDHPWISYGECERRYEELYDMQHYKVELEALNWLGMDYICMWLGKIFEFNNTFHTTNNRKNDSDNKWMQII
jgi:meiotic recombination protein SPO11